MLLSARPRSLSALCGVALFVALMLTTALPTSCAAPPKPKDDTKGETVKTATESSEEFPIMDQTGKGPVYERKVTVPEVVPLTKKQKFKRFFKDPYNIESLDEEARNHAYIYEKKALLASEDADVVEKDRLSLLQTLIGLAVGCGIMLLIFIASVIFYLVMVSRGSQVRYVQEELQPVQRHSHAPSPHYLS